MKQQIHKELLFSTPLYVTDFGDVEVIKNLKKKVLDCPVAFEDSLCKSTHDDLHKRNEFHEIHDLINPFIKSALDDIGLIREGHRITCMWSNISKPQNRHNMHLHPNSFLSGVLYLNCPPNPGNIGFRDPRHSMEMMDYDYKEDSSFRHRTIEVEPKTGRLILFPSWLQHGTRPGNFIGDKRISLSFNVMPICSVNDYGRKIEYH